MEVRIYRDELISHPKGLPRWRLDRAGSGMRANAHGSMATPAFWVVKCQVLAHGQFDGMTLSRCHTLATMRQPSGPSTKDS